MASKRLEVLRQNHLATWFRCPKCNDLVALWHTEGDLPNADIGRLDLGEQNFNRVVCANIRDGNLCPWSADLESVGNALHVIKQYVGV